MHDILVPTISTEDTSPSIPSSPATEDAPSMTYRPTTESDLSDMPPVMAHETYAMDTGSVGSGTTETTPEPVAPETPVTPPITPSPDEIGYRPVEEADLPDLPSVTANEPYIMDSEGSDGGSTGESGDREPISLVAMDTRETDLKAARLLADEQLDAELRDLRERLFETNYRGTNRFSRIVRSVAKAVRSTFVHPV